MPKMLIDLSSADAEALKDYAAKYGHKVKPFVEYLIRVQLGILPEPSLKVAQLKPRKEEPAKEPVKATPERSHAEEPKKSALVKAREELQAIEPLQEGTTEGPRKRDLAKFTERVSSQIFTDGVEFMLNKFGRRTFHKSQDEAERTRDNS